jgi:hypothetical protein
MTPKLVEPGDDARAAERVVALITRYAVRFDPVDRITFYSGIVRAALPFELILQLKCAPTISQKIDGFSTIRKLHYRPAHIERERKADTGEPHVQRNLGIADQ